MYTMMSNAAVDELGSAMALRFLGTEKPPSRKLNIDELVTKMLGLHLTYEFFMGETKSRIGFLSDGTTHVTVLGHAGPTDLVFPAGTVVLNRNLLEYPDCEPIRRFTLAHEAAHQILSRYMPAGPEEDPQRPGEFAPETLQKFVSIRELQANRLAAALLMPDFLMADAFAEYFGCEPVPLYGSYQYALEDKLKLARWAREMGVSFTALTLRLKALNMVERRPITELFAREEAPYDAALLY